MSERLNEIRKRFGESEIDRLCNFTDEDWAAAYAIDLHCERFWDEREETGEPTASAEAAASELFLRYIQDRDAIREEQRRREPQS